MLTNLLKHPDFRLTPKVAAELVLIADHAGVVVDVQMLPGIAASPNANNALANGQLNPVLGDPWCAPDCKIWPIL